MISVIFKITIKCLLQIIMKIRKVRNSSFVGHGTLIKILVHLYIFGFLRAGTSVPLHRLSHLFLVEKMIVASPLLN